MNITVTVTENNGKHVGRVSDGDSILFRSPEYFTADMARAAAKCWKAFRVVRMALAAMKRDDERNTVTVSTGTHILPPALASTLRCLPPHSRRNMPGTLASAMNDRRRAVNKVAELLGIPRSEADTIAAMLRSK